MEETQKKTDKEVQKRVQDGDARSKSKKQRSKSCNSAKGDLFQIDRERAAPEPRREKSKESGD